MSTDSRPYYVQFVDTQGVTREQYAGNNATGAGRLAAVIQAGGATGVCLVRKGGLPNAPWRPC